MLGAALLWAMVAQPVLAADPFYESLMRRGLTAAEAGDPARSAELLRLASFGLLDEPETLTRCLVHLALAHDRAGRAEDFRSTFERLVEIEERFATYRAVDLSLEVRADFERALQRHVPPSVLRTVGAFSDVVPKIGRAHV